MLQDAKIEKKKKNQTHFLWLESSHNIHNIPFCKSASKKDILNAKPDLRKGQLTLLGEVTQGNLGKQ